jgi:predicted dinucleotide-binding enzyme
VFLKRLQALIGKDEYWWMRPTHIRIPNPISAKRESPGTSSEIVAEMASGSRLVKSISNMPMEWIQDFSPNKPRTVLFTSGDDTEAKQCVIELINSTGLVAIDLGSLRLGGAMHEIGAPLSGIEFHFVQRLRRRRELREKV